MERKIIVFSTCRSFIFPGSACRSYLEKYRSITTLSAINVLLVVKCLDFEVIIIQNTNQSRSKRTVQYSTSSPHCSGCLQKVIYQSQSKEEPRGAGWTVILVSEGTPKRAPRMNVYIFSLENDISIPITNIKAHAPTHLLLKNIHFPHRELMLSTELLLPTLASFSRCEVRANSRGHAPFISH
jgi:hypothetical protein